MVVDDGSIESLLVSLYVYGDHLLPEVISSRLGALPTRSQTRGELKGFGSGKSAPTTTGMWELKSAHHSLILSDHISHILRKMRTPIHIPSIEGVDDVHLDVYVSGLVPGDGYRHLDLELTAGDVLLLGQIGAAVRFSIVD